jgi:hypothetical protein
MGFRWSRRSSTVVAMPPRIVRSSDSSVTEHHLNAYYRRLHPDTWIKRDVQLTALVRAEAAWVWCRGRAVLAGYSAAAVLGAKYLPDSANAELIVPGKWRSPPGITVRRRSLPDTDRCIVRGIAVTTPLRTAFDICRDRPAAEAVEAVDALYQATSMTKAQLVRYCADVRNSHGNARVPRIVEMTDEGAESIWETRSRLCMVEGGLPRPQTQIKVFSRDGQWIGRFDLGYEEWKVLIEYDGDQHFEREQRNRDIVRWNALEADGWRVIRVKAAQLMNNPELLIEQIRTVLRAAGAPI